MRNLDKLLNKVMGDPKLFSLRHRIVNIIVFVCILAFILCFIVNVIYDKDYINSIICLLGALLNIMTFYLSRIKLKYLFSFQLFFVLVTYVLLPLFWFKNGGTQSGIHFYYFVVAGSVIIILSDIKRIIFMILNLVSYLGLIYLEYKFPHFIINYSNPVYRYMDICLDSFITMGILAFLYYAIVKNYDIEHEKVMDLIKVDYLSNCYNRRYFIEVVKKAIDNYYSNNLPFSIIIIDIDNFKQVNDEKSHIEGDNLIKEIGSFLKETIPDSIIARYGGDEFIILIDNLKLKAAISSAEDICIKARQKKWLNNLDITLSVGVAEYKGGSIEDIIRDADNQLYNAKKSGKDRIAF